LAAVPVLALAAPAEAHTALQDTAPRQNAVVADFPGAVQLAFNEDVLDIGANVKLTAPDGRTLKATDTTVSGSSVTATYPEATAGGRYRVSWRVLADDGHPVAGEYAFTYTPTGRAATKTSPAGAAPTGAAPASAAPASAATAPAATTAAASKREGSSVPWGIVGLGALAVVGVLGFRRLRGAR
jgi:methionine-rich copper-binding protein CopC